MEKEDYFIKKKVNYQIHTMHVASFFFLIFCFYWEDMQIMKLHAKIHGEQFTLD